MLNAQRQLCLKKRESILSYKLSVCYFISIAVSPDFITSFRRNGAYINGHFTVFKNMPKRSFRVFFLYSFNGFSVFSASASASAEYIALLIPSSELGLINPAASPIKKTFPSPRMISRELFGRKTMHPSVSFSLPRIIPCDLSLVFSFSKFSLQSFGANAPPKIVSFSLVTIHAQQSVVSLSKMQA